MLCVWYGDQLGIIYYELLKLSSENITGEKLYRMQVVRLSRAFRVAEKRPQYNDRHEKVILQHDNAGPPHVAKVAKKICRNVEEMGNFTSPTVLPEVATSHFHLTHLAQWLMGWLTST
nr:transposase [Hymenolepis microstoma]